MTSIWQNESMITLKAISKIVSKPRQISAAESCSLLQDILPEDKGGWTIR